MQPILIGLLLAGLIIFGLLVRLAVTRRRARAERPLPPLLFSLEEDRPGAPMSDRRPARTAAPSAPPEPRSEPAPAPPQPATGRVEASAPAGPEEVEADAPAPPVAPQPAAESMPAGPADDQTVQLLPGRLEVLAGIEREQAIRFIKPARGEPEVTLGRSGGSPGTHIQLRAATVSRIHARMNMNGNGWAIANLSSTNPVLVNDIPLEADNGSHTLQDGDRIELGEVVFRFRSR